MDIFVRMKEKKTGNNVMHYSDFTIYTMQSILCSVFFAKVKLSYTYLTE